MDISDLITKSGRTDAEISRASGLSQTTINLLRHRKRTSLSIATIPKLAKGLGIKPEKVAVAAVNGSAP